jgi:hypothetical protein
VAYKKVQSLSARSIDGEIIRPIRHHHPRTHLHQFFCKRYRVNGVTPELSMARYDRLRGARVELLSVEVHPRNIVLLTKTKTIRG